MPIQVKFFVAYLHLIYYEVSKCLLYLYLDIIPTRNTDTLERVSVSKWHHMFFERYEHYPEENDDSYMGFREERYKGT